MARKPGGEAAIRARIGAAPGVSPEEGHRLAGLLEAECHLSVLPNNRDDWKCGCSVSLRDDDRQTLIDAQARLGLGNLVAASARNGSRPQVQWKIESKLECAALVDLLDQHQLRGRKLNEYFAGFFSGEGCFALGLRNARFIIKLRRDDRPFLRLFGAGFRWDRCAM